jgi:hypothetical protein
MKLELKNFRGTQEQFDSLTLLEKRTYIIQTEQEETNWWLRTAAKLYVIGFVLGIFAFIALMASFKK